MEAPKSYDNTTVSNGDTTSIGAELNSKSY
jgi:hypothetical protein